MRDCYITIATTTEGIERSVRYEGTMGETEGFVRIEYREPQAVVKISIDGTGVTIVREGDYTLSLRLEKEKRKQGTIGLGGAEGEVFTYTEYLAWSVKQNSILLSAKYDLIVGEPQKVKLRLSAIKR